MTIPTLDLLFLDSHSAKHLVIGDISTYGSFTVSTPTIEITIPNAGTKVLEFVKGSIQIYNSNTLGITCGDECDAVDLPDGIWKVKYSVAPVYKYYVEKTFIRVEKLMAKFDSVYVKLDFMQCDDQIKKQDKDFLFAVQEYIAGAIAAANKCANKSAMQQYRRANEMLDNYINNHCFLQ
jgi:hypothetical protein